MFSCPASLVQDLTMLILLLSTFTAIYGFYLWIVSRKYGHLPGNLGSSYPVIGNLYHSLRNSFLSHDECLVILERFLPKGGGLYVLWFYCQPVVAISDPFIVEKLAEHPDFINKEPLVYENVTNLWKGTFTYAYSDTKWKQRRKMINHTLNTHNLLEYHNTFVKMSRRMLERMKLETEPFSVQKYTMMATLDSIIETHYGCDLDLADNNEIYNLIHWGMKKISKTFINPVFGFFFNIYIGIFNTMKPLDQIIETCVKNTTHKQENANKGKNKNLYLNTVLQHHLSANNSTKEIRQELMELLLVGSHTVGMTINAALIFLAALPEIQEKVWQEQQDIFGDSDRDPTIIDVQNMDYLERVLKEVLRFISGPTVIRKTKAEINIDDKIIPKETSVLICSWLMRMDNKYWERPLKFDPDRYLRNEPFKNFKHSFSFFGYGTRNCPGSRYSYNEGKVFISTVLRNYKVVSDFRFEDIKLSAQIMMEMKGEYNISIVKRKPLVE